MDSLSYAHFFPAPGTPIHTDYPLEVTPWTQCVVSMAVSPMGLPQGAPGEQDLSLSALTSRSTRGLAHSGIQYGVSGFKWTGLLIKENPKPEAIQDLRGLTERWLAAGVRLGLARRQEHDRAATSQNQGSHH